MMPFEERWWDQALDICHDTVGLGYLDIEKREGTLAWRIACALQEAWSAGAKAQREWSRPGTSS